MSQLHIRYDGQSLDLDLSDLPDVGALSSDGEIRSSVATHLGVPLSKLNSYAVDKNEESGDITLRPQAVFG